MTLKLTLDDKVARIIAKHWRVTSIAVGTYPERGYTDTRKAAAEVLDYLRKWGLLNEDD